MSVSITYTQDISISTAPSVPSFPVSISSLQPLLWRNSESL